MYAEVYQTDSAGHQRTVSHTDFPHAHSTRTVIVPLPLTLRGSRLTGVVAVNWILRVNPPQLQPGVPFGLYVFDVRYTDLPRTTFKRIPGGDCRRGHATNERVHSAGLIG